MAVTIPGAYSTTTLAGGSTVTAVCNALETALLAFQTGQGTPAWQLIETISASPYNKIFYSKGDPDLNGGVGDTAIFIEIDEASAVVARVRAFGDYEQGSAGATFTGTTGITSNIILTNTTESIDLDFMVNEYEFILIRKQESAPASGSFIYSFVRGGQIARSHVQAANRGRAFTTASAIAGAGIVIPLDRDLTDPNSAFGTLTVGAPVWVYDVTPLGSSLVTSNSERTTITAITPTTITLTLASPHAAGAHIGQDPSPNYAQGGGSSPLVSTNVVSFFNEFTSAIVYSTGFSTWPVKSALNFTPGISNPNGEGLRGGCRILLDGPSAINPNQGLRGHLYQSALWPFETAVADTDIIQDNYDATRKFKPYRPAVGTGLISSGFTMALQVP